MERAGNRRLITVWATSVHKHLKSCVVLTKSQEEPLSLSQTVCRIAHELLPEYLHHGTQQSCDMRYETNKYRFYPAFEEQVNEGCSNPRALMYFPVTAHPAALTMRAVKCIHTPP